MQEVELLPGERIDDLIRKEIKIIQNKEGFCFSIDAVLLAHFATLKEEDNIIDLGTGSGVIPLLLASRNNSIKVTGVEIQARVAEMARRSVILNGFEEIIDIKTGDIKEITKTYKTGDFDMVISNPPYISPGSGILNEGDSIAISKHELKCTLEDVVVAGSKMLNPKGRFAMVHRPHRLTDIFCSLRNNRLEPKRLRFVHPQPGRKPTTILIEAIKDGQAGLTVLEPLYVYNSDGNYTAELLKIYYGE